MLANDVAVEALDEHAALLELGGDEAGDGRLAGGGEAGEPDDEASLTTPPRGGRTRFLVPAQRPSRPAPGSVEWVSPIEA